MEPNPPISKLILTQRDDFYYIEVYESSDNNINNTPKYKFSFPFPPNTQQQALEKARKFGREMSQNNSIPLEEKL